MFYILEKFRHNQKIVTYQRFLSVLCEKLFQNSATGGVCSRVRTSADAFGTTTKPSMIGSTAKRM